MLCSVCALSLPSWHVYAHVYVFVSPCTHMLCVCVHVCLCMYVSGGCCVCLYKFFAWMVVLLTKKCERCLPFYVTIQG